MTTDEHQRLAQSPGDENWKRWGPYLSERAWGTVREDYSEHGEAWEYFPFENAHQRAYRWNEDGLAGLCDAQQRVCLCLGLWNGRDPILKERLFGLTGNQGNHGEDCKELYYFLDSTPTHSYMRMRYKYPQDEFPYRTLVTDNAARGKHERELELLELMRDAFTAGRYFDVDVEYAKAAADDIVCTITVHNRAGQPALLHVVPQLWFRNTWSWGDEGVEKPALRPGSGGVLVDEPSLGRRYWAVEGDASMLFCDNDTNYETIFGAPSDSDFHKDGLHRYIVDGQTDAVARDGEHTKVGAHLKLEVPAGGSVTVRWRLSDREHADPFAEAAAITAQRRAEADAFYDTVHPPECTEEERNIQRQAYAGLMWTKQFYYFDVARWLDGDPGQPPPPASRHGGRNREWRHLNNADVISMPDSWEYPWYAVWDLAFHCVPIAEIDTDWAKRQLLLVLREWYMHPNGQIPAYEWAFGDVNPPVHAWAALQVYRRDLERTGVPDIDFLERVFHKLMLNFTWWVNRKDEHGDNLFQGGFLGLDNIGVFDRSQPLPTGGHLEQADGTAWMGAFSLHLLAMSLEIAQHRPAYADVATKFFEHFCYIAAAMSQTHGGLWDEEDGFYYDVLHLPDETVVPLRIRSFVGLIPLFAVMTFEQSVLDKLPGFAERFQWFVDNREQMLDHLTVTIPENPEHCIMLSIASPDRLRRMLSRVLDPSQFLADHGLRALSREHGEHPFEFRVGSEVHTVAYEPGESTSHLFGGNSNWRGPIWFPVNHLLVESLREYHLHLGPDFQVPLPGEDGRTVNLCQAADLVTDRLTSLFLPDENGRRPAHGDEDLYASDPHFRDLILFYEYFHGETGAGVGASHQTGWTALVATLLARHGPRER